MHVTMPSKAPGMRRGNTSITLGHNFCGVVDVWKVPANPATEAVGESRPMEYRDAETWSWLARWFDSIDVPRPTRAINRLPGLLNGHRRPHLNARERSSFPIIKRGHTKAVSKQDTVQSAVSGLQSRSAEGGR